jgi:hypothetical protein
VEAKKDGMHRLVELGRRCYLSALHIKEVMSKEMPNGEVKLGRTSKEVLPLRPLHQISDG